MAGSLDMSLDDLITKNKPHLRRGRARRNQQGRGGPTRSARRFHTLAAAAPYHHQQQLNFHQQAPPAYGFVAQPMAMMAAAMEEEDKPTRLYISNLDYNVSNEDIKDLFSELGEVMRYSINYDKSGRSKGTAEVVFSTRSAARAAVNKYNNVHLDGKPMKIEVVGTNIEAPAAPAIFAFATPPAGNFSFPPKSGAGRGGGRGWPRRGHWRGRGQRGGNLEVSAEDLDADLDKYHHSARQNAMGLALRTAAIN